MKLFVKNLFLVVLISCFGFAGSHAGWIEDGVPLTRQWGAIGGGVIASDGSSGAIIAFRACHDGVGHIIAQRVNSLGVALWGEDGIDVCTVMWNQSNPAITSDGAGGAIVTWMDPRSGNWDVYAQRVNASGAVQWTTDGVALSTAGNEQVPQITSDGAGGAIIAWMGYRNGNYDIYAQRVDASGAVQWTVDGIALSTATGNEQVPQITSDGAGGAIVTWQDYRNGNNYDIYAQRVNASGAVQWAADGVALCTAMGDQQWPQITSDGAGGAIVMWQDYRNGSNYDIYAQRVNASGAVQWTTNGLALCTATGDQRTPTITSDGAGGSVVTWYDGRNGSNFDIYAQRVDSSGSLEWTPNGVGLCTATGDQWTPTITSDGAGGSIVAWYDYRGGSNSGIYAQRVNALGAVQWTVDGVALSPATGNQDSPTMTSDGVGGAIVTWEDHRSGAYSDIYVQRVNGLGAVQWTTNGVGLCTATGNQYSPTITSDGAGGAIVTWEDYRSGGYSDIYVQRVNALGAVQWTTNGVTLCTATGDQYNPTIVSDGAGGAIVTWWDQRSGNDDIYVQRVNALGAVQWAADGVALCTATGEQQLTQITSDGAGGVIVTWCDSRSGSYDIYAQRVSASGAVQWTANGVALCTATGDQYNPTIVFDGAGGAIVSWMDARSGGNDIYAQRVNGLGAVQWAADGVALCTATGEQQLTKITSDGAGGAIVSWMDGRSGSPGVYAQRVNASGVIRWTANGVALCSATRYEWYPMITSDGAGGAIVTWWDERGGNDDIYAQGVNSSGSVQWTANGVALCTATGDQKLCQVISDGRGGAIVAWEDDRCGALIYAQRVDAAGHVAPQTATLLQNYSGALDGGSIRVDWVLSEIDDGARFSIFRSSAPDWEFIERKDATIDKNRLSFMFTDETCLPGSTYKYRVGCEVGTTRRILFETDAITVPALPLTLYQNHPNPFNPQTVIRFYVPEAQDIFLDVYNIAGERVARLAEGKTEKGYHEVVWDGRSSSGTVCSSGVYFSRLKAGKSTISRKMVIMR